MKSFIKAVCFSFALLTLGFVGSAQAQESAQVQMESVNVNTADASVLAEKLTGVGAAKAQAIVEYRKTNGPFGSLEDLMAVKGLGAAFIEKNKGKIVF